jgi:hypothetical protein
MVPAFDFIFINRRPGCQFAVYDLQSLMFGSRALLAFFASCHQAANESFDLAKQPVQGC